MRFGARGPSLGAVVLLAIVVAALLRGCDDRGDEGNPNGDIPTGREATGEVVEVTDGDTIEVELPSGVEDVRYIGVDTPEVDPNVGVECFGSDASELNAELVDGKRVRLVFDAERRDRYGRLLAYVYAGDTFVNAELLRRGAARTLTIAPNDSFAARFARLAQEAANAGRGLWGAC
jgi:endonuclease YncB( thermonuclease family)